MNNNIMIALKARQLVVVLGNDLSMVKLSDDLMPEDNFLKLMDSVHKEGDITMINVNDLLAYKLWKSYNPEQKVPAPFNLNNVFESLFREGLASPEDLKAFIIHEVKSLKDDQIDLEPFQKIARMGNIETILTVNYDDFLERAFKTEGRPTNPPVNFSIQDSDTESGNLDIDKAIPSIYNLMGNIQDTNFAVTEEMQLEYLYKLLVRKDARTNALFNATKDKSLLLIGCSFPNWFMRFFIRTMNKKRLKNGRSKFVASDKTALDRDLALFLKNNRTSVIPIGLKDKESKEVYKDSGEFVNKLFDAVSGEAEMVTDMKPRYEEKIFLSYSRRDTNLITKLKNEFKKNGVELFFDNDSLRNGEDYAAHIKKYLNKCDYFLPLISENSIKSEDSFVYKKEWMPAIYTQGTRQEFNLFREGQEDYIRPYIIDTTQPTDDRIPEEIRKMNITTIEDENKFPDVVRDFIQENNLTEIADNNGK